MASSELWPQIWTFVGFTQKPDRWQEINKQINSTNPTKKSGQTFLPDILAKNIEKIYK